MTATGNHSTQGTTARLFVAFELGWSKIKIASTCDPLQKPRIQEIPARDLEALHKELAKAKKRQPGQMAQARRFEDLFWAAIIIVRVGNSLIGGAQRLFALAFK